MKRADSGGDGSGGGKGSDSSKGNAKPKTRGKPPKKCLAESPPHEEDKVGDMKAESMKFAAAIRAEFDKPKYSSATSSNMSASTTISSSQPLNSKSSSLRDVRIPRDRHKRKRVGEEPLPSQSVVSKTPKIVIKFAKDNAKSSPSVGGGGQQLPNINSNVSSDTPLQESRDTSDNSANKNGLDASPFDFVENMDGSAGAEGGFRQTPAHQALPMVDGTVDSSAFSSMNSSPAAPGTPGGGSEGSVTTHNKLPKLKIKVPTA